MAGVPNAGHRDSDARADARERLTALLEEGLRGPATEWTEADAEHLRLLAAGED